MDRVLIFILYTLLIIIIYIDIKKKYIPNFLNFSVFILAIFIKGVSEVEAFFIGASSFALPVIILYGYVSDLLNKEVFGFGDIKLIISLGGILYQNNISLFFQIYLYYLLSFSLATIILISTYLISKLKGKKIKLRGKELAFTPYLCFSFLILYNMKFLLGFIYE